MAGEGLDPLAHGVQGDAGRPEDLRGRAAVLPEQARQHVLGTDVVVVELPGLFLGEANGSMGLVSKPLEHDITPVSAAPAQYPVCTRRAHPRRARNAAVLTRFWHEVEQYRRVPLREVST